MMPAVMETAKMLSLMNHLFRSKKKKSLTDDVVVTSVDTHTHQFHYNPVNEE